jgi:hypothetical protein
MQFVTARELRLSPGRVWLRLQKEKSLIITSNGTPLGMLSELPGNDVEKAMQMWRRLTGQWALQEIRREAKAKGTDRLTIADIDREIMAVRKSRRKHQSARTKA